MDHIVSSSEPYRVISWIISYHRLDCIGWIGSYRIDWIVSGNTGFYALAGYWLDGTDGTDGMDGALVGRGWDGPTLAGSETGAPPLAPKQERHHWLLRGGGLWEAVAGTNSIGAARDRSFLSENQDNTNRVHTNQN